MAELVDALVSNTSGSDAVPVRSRLRVQKKSESESETRNEVTKFRITEASTLTLSGFLLPGTLEIILHKQHLKFHCICPVCPVMCTRPYYVIVLNIAIEQLLMQVLIYIIEEILRSAIYNDSQ